MPRPPALKLTEVLTEIRMSPSAFYRLRARGRAPRMIKLPNGELHCRRPDLDAWWEACIIRRDSRTGRTWLLSTWLTERTLPGA
ncbi:helix-turn-helix transcriptional regulator [Streptomyces sp. NPDC096311]|uniref:helix-turn-helix transcriptional regulator n=1 Tax=Streptomyces sp. NPDC096311 TaxID=3366083 RepID=UPI00380339C8